MDRKKSVNPEEIKLKLGLIKKMNEDEFTFSNARKKNLKNNNISSKIKNSENKKEKKSKIKNEKKSKDKKEKKSKKSKSIEGADTTETDVTSRKWDDSKGKELTKGPFNAEEEKLLINSFLEYAFEKNLDQEDLIKLITEKQTKKEESVWTKIAECLPTRSVQSIHNYCHRKFNPNNYKGNWTIEEVEKLMSLVKEHGPKWEIIGKEMERTATNVKDKYKQVGGKNYRARIKEFNLIVCLKLIKYVQEWLNDKSNDNDECVILKYPYKFKNNLEKKKGAVFFYDSDQNKFLIDSIMKETTSKVLIKNILKKLVDSDTLFKIVDNNMEISWSFVSEKLKIYSATDCHNNWDKILREYGLEKRTKLNKDLKMIKQ
jgi:hypothetical protein